MGELRKCRITGKLYTDRNIPHGRVDELRTAKGFYKIMADTHNRPTDSWYNDSFIGCQYAVFKLVKNGEKRFWQQISKWYFNYTNAFKIMYNLQYGKTRKNI